MVKNQTTEKVDTAPDKKDNEQDYGAFPSDRNSCDDEKRSNLVSEQSLPKAFRGCIKIHDPDVLLLFIKYLMFFTNFVFSILGFALFGFGVWGLVDKQSLISDRIGYLGTDPMLSFVMVGLIVSFLSVSGCLGFIRENIYLLRCFSLGISILMVTQLLSAIIIFAFKDQIIGSVKNSLLVALSRYHDDSDLKFIMDEVQLGMECCGVQSYTDWAVSLYFNCSSPGVYACGVPYSCCIDPFENGTVINSQCGVGAMQMGETMAGSVIFLGGCVPQMILWLQRKFWDIAAVFLLVMVIQLVCVVCAQRMLGEIKFIKKHMEGMNISSLVEQRPRYYIQ
uniref:Tetraspanin 10 n=1 Tax=Xenopus tropicalis TaxID=8364 RepID=A0A6I8PXX1_XENTR